MLVFNLFVLLLVNVNRTHFGTKGLRKNISVYVESLDNTINNLQDFLKSKISDAVWLKQL